MLDELGIVGISWRQVGSEALADFSLPTEQRDARLEAFARAEALAELAYVETCNRVEIVFAAADISARDLRVGAFELLTGAQPAPGEAERKLKAWRGEGACEHLFLVAAGLDSAAVGEVEIAGQVRLAHDRAQATGLCGPRLSLAFEEAGRIAGAIRGRTALGEGSVSLAEVAMTHVRRRLAETPGTVALVGVSAMTERAALSLAKADVPFVVVNRTIAKATELAERFGADCMSLDEFRRLPPALAVVLCATGSPEPVLDAVVLRRLAAEGAVEGKPPLGIDMAVPADIDPDGCRRIGMPRIGMDDIVRQAEANRDARLLAAADARALVDEALPRLRKKVVDRVYGPLFGALQRHYQETASTAVQRLAKDLGELDAETRRSIDVWAASLARRMAHIPTVGLKGLMRYGPEGSLDAFLEGLDPERRGLLRGAVHGGGRHTDLSEEADDPKA